MLHWRRATALAVVLTCGTAAGCNRFAPDEYYPIDPPAAYRTWWASTEGCSGLSGNYDRIKFFAVPGYAFDCPSGRCVGHWESSHRIYVAEEWLDHEMVIRHEMLHDLVGHDGHPNPPFGQGCPLTWGTWPNAAGVPVRLKEP